LEPPPILTPKQSDYMHWAKTRQSARFNLATSGVGGCPIEELAFDPRRLAIHGDNRYGYAPLVTAIAAKTAASPECVVTAQGTSFANHLAMATLLEPGDEVLIEHPTYPLLLDTARHLGAHITRFPRREENEYALDPEAIRAQLTPRTKLIVITNLHNPSSALAPEPALRATADLARSVGARLLVDEVYLDAVYENTPPSAVHLGPEVVVTSSLTKIYGLSGLRCGWILAEPSLARAMWRLNDVFAATPVHPGELLSVAAFERLDRLRERARRVVEGDRAALGRFLEAHAEVSSPRTCFGTTAFLRLHDRPVEPFLEDLRTRFETSAVPGRFFEMPDHFRIGMGVDHEMFVEGLQRLGLVLGEQ
jgi:aspartate/methionine/tyrosine aminotransferase